MEIKHDFEADNKFFVDNYGTLLDLYAGKTIIVADDRVLFVADDDESAEFSRTQILHDSVLRFIMQN